MSQRGVTRRSLLAGLAGAAAGGLARPGLSLATTTAPPLPRLKERWVGTLSAAPRTIELGGGADLIGVEWQGPADASVELRLHAGGRWSPWVAAGGHGHGPDVSALSQRQIGDPVWAAGAGAVQLRCAPALEGVRLHIVEVGATAGPHGPAAGGPAPARAAGFERATPVLAAGPGQPPIIARRAWAQGMAPPRVAPEYGSVQMAFVHHTENPNGYTPGEVPAMLLAIYVFHRYVNGWDDIGYNFVVDLYGRIFEARAGGIDEPVIGAHAGGYNYVSSGVAVLGSFMSVPISTPARNALRRLLAWKLSLHGVSAEGRVTVRVSAAGASYSRFPANARVPLPHIAGHRDADSTDCPGDVLYGQLPGVRRDVRALAPRPARATLALGAPAASSPQGSPAAGTVGPPAASGAPPAAPAGALEARVQFLDGAPIAGAQVAVQARSVSHRGEAVSERTLAEGSTDAHGQFSLPAPLVTARGGAWLRALCSDAPGAGALASAPLHLPAAAPTTPAATPGAPATAPASPPSAAPPS